MKIDRFDHIVLTVADLDAAIAFYTNVLGMIEVNFEGGRKALAFGESKINLHQRGHEFEPKARVPTPGSADLCLIVQGDVDTMIEELASAGIAVVEGPVDRAGALGVVRSVYIRDPDGNLIELSSYD